MLGEPRSLLSGDDLSDKDAYGPPAVLLAGFPVEEVAGVSLFSFWVTFVPL